MWALSWRGVTEKTDTVLQTAAQCPAPNTHGEQTFPLGLTSPAHGIGEETEPRWERNLPKVTQASPIPKAEGLPNAAEKEKNQHSSRCQ